MTHLHAAELRWETSGRAQNLLVQTALDEAGSGSEFAGGRLGARESLEGPCLLAKQLFCGHGSSLNLRRWHVLTYSYVIFFEHFLILP